MRDQARCTSQHDARKGRAAEQNAGKAAVQEELIHA
jgi:hypothetical protein